MKKRLLLPLLLALPSPGKGQAILNVEALQGEEVEGTHGEVSARLRFASGNTDISQVSANLGIGHLGDTHWLRAYAGIERLEQKGKDILHNRYLHLRYNYRFSERLRTFHFAQIQTNQNLFLDQRRLLGSGIRYRILEGSKGRLELGTGLMLEVERLNKEKLSAGEDSNTEAVRVANLVVGSGPVGEGNQWVMVVYYQPNVEGPEDSRLSGDAGLRVGLSDSLDLDVSFTWRHDSRAPAGLDEDDLGFISGFRYAIR
jgi:putative salt-induced outer membrane protein YdiY